MKPRADRFVSVIDLASFVYQVDRAISARLNVSLVAFKKNQTDTIRTPLKFVL